MLLAACNLPGNSSAPVIQQTVIATTVVPTASPTPQTQTTPTLRTPLAPRHFENFDGVSFYYFSVPGKKVTARVVDATSATSPDAHPKMDQFDFPDYAPESQVKPEIKVFSVQDYESLAGNPVNQQIDKLNQLLTAHPNDSSANLPFLPLEPAAQLMHAQLKYVKFQDGQGIRYITEYGQQAAPLDNKMLFYTFQGITDNGAYYVSASLPLGDRKLAGDDGAVQDQNPATFQANYSSYTSNIEQLLNNQKPNSFTPNINLMDLIIHNLVVNKNEAVPTPTVAGTGAKCTNEASYIADITVPDDTSLQLGTTFVKMWRLQNIGTCTWTPDYQVVFISGDGLGAPGSAPLSGNSVPPNGTVDVSLSMTAPNTPGTYQGFYKLRSPDGTLFGVEPAGANPFWVMINAVDNNAPTDVPAPPQPPTNTPVPGIHIPIIPIKPPIIIKPDLPDLVISHLSLSASVGLKVTVSVTITNQGQGDANGQFTTKWWPDSKSGTTAPPQCVWVINSLAAGQSVTKTCQYTYQYLGTYTSHAYVDYDHNITESDENNNTASNSSGI